MYQNRHFEETGASPALDGAIAVTGMACRFAGARTPADYWAMLRDGVEGIVDLGEDELIAAGVPRERIADPAYVRRAAPLADMECFDAAVFGMSPRDAAIMDPQHRHFLEVTWEALEDAGCDPARFDGSIGLFAGSGHNAYLPANLLTNPRLVREVGHFLLRHTGNDKDFLTTRVSYLLNLRGPSVAVQTACSTSLVAVHMAVQSLLSGECAMAIAGGVSIELPHRHGYAHEEGGILSPDGRCRPFDAGSRGTVFGSGAGVVVLRRLADAIADGDHVHAVIRGTAINNDGAGKIGYLAPSVDGQAAAISEALSIADVDAASIGYVEAHGTGTPVGDPIEIAALAQAFGAGAGPGTCAIGSVKGNIGHTDTAAGIAGLIKVALAMRHRTLPATLHFAAPNPDCRFAQGPFAPVAATRPWTAPGDGVLRAGVSSLGVGGTNAHVVMEEAPPAWPGGPSRSHQLLAISARSETALAATADAIAGALAAADAPALADAAFTLSTGRAALEHRRILIAPTAGGAGGEGHAARAVPGRRAAFLFCGAGAQYADMARGLYREDTTFRRHVDASLDILAGQGAADVARWLFPTAEDAAAAPAAMRRPTIALPALFVIQVALARTLIDWGIEPDGMIGHSSGEYAAAHIADVLRLDDALRLVRERGRLFETLAGGAMLSVPLAADALAPLLPADVAIAAVNAPALCVASGPAAAIDALAATLATRDVEAQRVHIAVAAHSAMLDPILAEFRAFVATIPLARPTRRYVSTLTGDWVDATDADYWTRHLRETVRFTDGLDRLLADNAHALIEVGPGRTLASLARQHPACGRDRPVLHTVRQASEDRDDCATLLDGVGRAWAHGVAIDWGAFWRHETRRRVPLPTYRFDRVRHWIDPGAPAAAIDADGDGAGAPADAEHRFYEPVWRRDAIDRLDGPRDDGPVLILDDGHGLGDGLARRWRAAGRVVVTVAAGRRYRRYDFERYAVRPDEPDDYRALLDDLGEEQRPTLVVHAWLATGGYGLDVATATARGFFAPIALARALGDGAPVRILLVTDDAQRVAGETVTAPVKALALGPCRTIPREYPNIATRAVDVECDTDAAIAAIVAEAASRQDVDIAAWRRGERWTQGFVAAPRAAAGDVAGDALRIRRGGVYAITGGLGGIGLELARHLAETAGARLLLIGRTPLPPREAWAARARGDDGAADRIRAIEAIEAAGGAVMTAACDVADRAGLARAIAAAQRRFGRLDGVFHAAGVLDDGLIETKTPATAAAVLAPKLAGTLALDAALAGRMPDFVVLFSSVSAIAGIEGQVDYAAANAFLDAFAQSRAGLAAPRVVSLAWSRWREVGMAASAPRDPLDRPRGTPVPVDHPLIDAMHRDGDRVVACGTLAAATHWLLDEHRLADGTALIPGTGHVELIRAFAAAAVADGPLALRDIVFAAPFAVGDAGRDLRIAGEPCGDGWWQVAILGRARDAAGEWTRHVTAQVRPCEAAPPAPLRIAAIRAACPATGDAAAAFTAPSMRFGPRWDNLVALERGADEALLRLRLPDRFARDGEAFALHPALLDFATAGAQQLLAAADGVLAPMAYGAIRVHAPLPAEIVSHVRLRSQSDADARFDVSVASPDGTVLVEIEDFAMVRLADMARLAVTPTPPTPVDGLSVAEGMDALARILAMPAPHVIVSPAPLLPEIARGRRPRVVPPRPPAGTTAGDPPATETEAVVASLWSEMLGIDAVGRDANFYDLGGHSLLAVQFINRLRRRTGRQLALSALIDAPTVASVAALLDPEGAATPVDAGASAPPPRAPVVTIRAGEADGTPLFLVHDGLGETLLYRSLALRLDRRHPVYGLEPVRRADGEFAHTSIAAMARGHVERVRAMQPHGPYLLAGLCAGGVIAFEMARQLQDAGEHVAFVGILDAADVDAARRRGYVTGTRVERIRALIAGGGLSVMPALIGKARNAAVWEVQSRVERMRRRRVVARLNHTAPAAPTGPALPYLQLYEVAHAAHQPEGLFRGGTVALFRAIRGDGAGDDIPYRELYADRVFGWGRRVADELVAIDVPGGHTSLLREPNVAVLASAMQQLIDAAMAAGAEAAAAPLLQAAE